jgi:hypothetical protein
VTEEKKDDIRGSVDRIRASITCGGCGATWNVDLDPARVLPHGWSLHDEVVDEVRGGGGDGQTSSVQGGYLLCEKCTKKMDDSPLVAADRSATSEEIARVLRLIDSDDETDDEEDDEGGDGGDEDDDRRSDDEVDEENEYEIRKVDENGQ